MTDKQVDLNKIRKHKLCICTPMYGGMCNNVYFTTMLNFQNLCFQIGLTFVVQSVVNQSIVSFARNELVSHFLDSDYTHLLFVDADIGFDPEDIIRLLHFDKDVIGIPCSQKKLQWNAIKEAVEKFPKIDPSDLIKYAGLANFHTETNINVFEPTEVQRLGTGIMLIKRCVFEKMIKNYPQIRYKCPNTEKTLYDFFPLILNNSYDNILKDKTPNDRYYSEDYSFCKMWQKIGGSIWICPWMKSKHIGTFEYSLDLPTISLLG